MIGRLLLVDTLKSHDEEVAGIRATLLKLFVSADGREPLTP